MNIIKEKSHAFGYESSTQWSITNPDEFIIWTTYDKKLLNKQLIIVENKKLSSILPNLPIK